MILKDRAFRPDPYRLAAQALGVEPGAGETDVKKAYRKTAQKFHPDGHSAEGRDSLYAARFHLATMAKNLLLARGGADEAKAVSNFTKAKSDYDKELEAAGLGARAEAPEPSRPAGTRRASSSEGPGPSSYARGRAWQAGSEEAKTWKPTDFGSGARTASGSGAWKPWRPEEFKSEGNGWNQTRRESAADTGARAQARPEAEGKTAGQPEAPPDHSPRSEASVPPASFRPTPRETYAMPQRPVDPRARAATEAYLDRSPAQTGRRVDLYV
jgi:curved DNA-binding protein CbpA